MPSAIPSLAQGIDGSTLGSASASVHAPRRSGSTAAIASTSSITSSNNGGGEKIKVCSKPSCSNPAKKKCNACKVARYCCAACQKQHWRLEPHGHKIECDVLAALKKKEAVLFTASDGAEAEQGSGGGGGWYASASGGGGAAYASRGGGGSGGGGSSSDDTEGTSWHTCSLCHQTYTGKMQMWLAEERVRRAQHLPETDAESLAAYGGLADALKADGKYSEAEIVYRKGLTLDQRLFGAEHPNTLAAANQLADCLRCQRKFEEAIKLHKNNLRSQRRVLGMEHRETLGTKSNLTIALYMNGQLEEAEKMFRTTLKTMKRVLPKNDDYILATLTSFAALLNDGLGKHAEAEAMFREALAIQLQMLGPEHPLTMRTKGNICITLSAEDKYAEALPLARECYRGYTKVDGPEHPRTLDAASRLGNVLMDLGEYAESEAILRETLVLQRAVLGPEHQDTKWTATILQTAAEVGAEDCGVNAGPAAGADSSLLAFVSAALPTQDVADPLSISATRPSRPDLEFVPPLADSS
eukprot:gene32493-biopygen5410